MPVECGAAQVVQSVRVSHRCWRRAREEGGQEMDPYVWKDGRKDWSVKGASGISCSPRSETSQLVARSLLNSLRTGR